MNIKNASFFTNKLSKAITLETIKCSQWTNNNKKAGFGSMLDCYNLKTNWIVISRSFVPKKNHLTLIKLRNTTIQIKAQG